jgi:TolB-like protein/Tfp pilus assembly protein PilF
MSSTSQDQMDPKPDPAFRGRKERLQSWKEIASYFERDVRTVQLWEAKEGLPVHRQEHSARASVYAYPDELDGWFEKRARRSRPMSMVEPASPAPAPSGASWIASRGPAWKMTLAMVAAALVAAGGWLTWRATHPSGLPGNGTLAVLPFLNLTGDTGMEYLSEGLSDELTTLLASDRPLRVVARTSAFEFKGKSEDVRAIGKQLNAAMLLEGSLEARGDQLRINVQLVRTSDGNHLWSQIYDTNRANTSAAEDSIVHDIAAVLKLPPAKETLANDTGAGEEAHELYLQGEYWWNQRSPSDEWKAIGYFNQAIDLEPVYARAYLGLAEAYVVLGVNNQAPPDEVLPKASAAAENALQIDAGLGEAHTILAHIRFTYDWDYPGAESEFRRAIDTTPDFAPARHWYGLMLMYQGRFGEAEQEIGHAEELDPLSPILPALRSRLDLYAGKYDAGIEICRDALRGNTDLAMPHYALGQIYLYQNQFHQALDEFEKYYELSGHDPDGLTNLAMVYAHMGNRAKAMELLGQIEDSRTGYSSAYNYALVYAALGDKESTYEFLDKAIAERSPALIQLLVDPAFASIRSEARFQEMLRRTGHVK